MAKEIELRARLGPDQFSALQNELRAANGYTEQRRCFIDYSTFIEGIGERKLDVRIRVTNGMPEIAVKKGQFGGAVREEALLPFEDARLEHALSVMALLGYTKGVAGGRRIYRGRIGDVEVALQEVLSFNNPSVIGEQFVEAEYVGASDNESEGVRTVTQFLSTRRIEPFSVDAWNEFVRALNESLNGVYEHGQTPTEIIRKLGQ